MRVPGAVLLFLLAAALMIIGIQSLIFHGQSGARVARANGHLLELLAARASGGQDDLASADEGPYRDLLADLEDPAWYLWPTATVLADRSGLEQAVRFNSATYLAQVGERGTARVMLTALHAGIRNRQMAGLVNFSLGRLYFELFRDRPSNDSLVRAVEYLRQSVRADPDSPLARRLFAYLLSLEQAQIASKEAEGNSNSPGEGEKAAEAQEMLIF